MIDLSGVSIKELEAALAAKKKQAAIDSAPKPLDNPDWSVVKNMAIKAVNDLVTNEQDELGGDDFDHYMYEAVMKAVYGPTFFDWYNSRDED